MQVVENTRPRAKGIDIARVIAMFFVMQSHVYVVIGSLNGQPHLAAGGVALFFLLAGYFSRFKTVADMLKRVFLLICFDATWSLYAMLVAGHGRISGWDVVWNHMVESNGHVMWFLHYLILGIVVLFSIASVPVWAKCVAGGVLYSVGCYMTVHGQYVHVCTNLPFALALMIWGNAANKISIQRVKELCALGWSEKSRPIIFSIAFVWIVVLYCMAVFNKDFLPEQITVILSSWAVLALGWCIEQCLPKVASFLFPGGVAAIFMYGFHQPTLRMMTSAHIRLTGDFPPPWVDYVAIAAIMILSACFYHKVIGRNKFVDAMLFGR